MVLFERLETPERYYWVLMGFQRNRHYTSFSPASKVLPPHTFITSSSTIYLRSETSIFESLSTALDYAIVEFQWV